MHDYIIYYIIIVIYIVLWHIYTIYSNRILIKYINYIIYRYIVHIGFIDGKYIELVWTITPAIILLVIAIPTYKLLYIMDLIIDPLITVKGIGRQWYWEYEYSSNNISYYNINIYNNINNIYNNYNNNNINYKYIYNNINNIYNNYIYNNNNNIIYNYIYNNYNMYYINNINNIYNNINIYNININYNNNYSNNNIYINNNIINYNNIYNNNINNNNINIYNLYNINNIYNIYNYIIDSYSNYNIYGSIRLVNTDIPLILPIDIHIRILITSADVIHSLAVPSLGIKSDAIPGRLNGILLIINRSGSYYGQCSELCGINHAYMPINIIGIDIHDYIYWYSTI